MTQAVQLCNLLQAHVTAHFIEYSPLLIALLLWLLSLSPGAKRSAVRSDGPRMEPVRAEHAGR